MEQTPTRKDGQIALKVLVTPHDLNHHGTMFGGAILSYFDIAGSNFAMAQVKGKVVQAGVKDAAFMQAIYENECLTFFARVLKIGRTSITIDAEAWRNRPASETPYEEDLVARSEITYVKVDKSLRPTPIVQG